MLSVCSCTSLHPIYWISRLALSFCLLVCPPLCSGQWGRSAAWTAVIRGPKFSHSISDVSGGCSVTRSARCGAQRARSMRCKNGVSPIASTRGISVNHAKKCKKKSKTRVESWPNISTAIGSITTGRTRMWRESCTLTNGMQFWVGCNFPCNKKYSLCIISLVLYYLP